MKRPPLNIVAIRRRRWRANRYRSTRIDDRRLAVWRTLVDLKPVAIGELMLEDIEPVLAAAKLGTDVSFLAVPVDWRVSPRSYAATRLSFELYIAGRRHDVALEFDGLGALHSFYIQSSPHF